MIFYLLYRLGRCIALALPLKASYRLACFIADARYTLSPPDRTAVIRNLAVVMGRSVDDEELAGMAKEVFRNFAKCLVDFFRFSTMDAGYVQKFVRIEGLGYIDEALAKGKGVIMLSAHIGNWELGGLALSASGYPINAVVLTHKNKRVNDFFRRQRLLGNVKPIEFGMRLRGCYRTLEHNGLLALLGDRDFSGNGIAVDFFGRRAVIPKGPAVLSQRVGSAIVPTFMVREKDDTFHLIMKAPIFPAEGAEGEEAVRSLIRRYLSVIESQIREYPTQWYAFREIWENGPQSVHPDPGV